MTGKFKTPRVVMIIQARMGSTRLPGKSTLDLAGAPLIGRIFERVKRCTKVDEIVLATTDNPDDNILEDLGNRYGVSVFRGSEPDVLDRYYQAAKAFNADVAVRIPGDNPVPEPGDVDKIIEYHLGSDNDFSTNYPDVLDNGWPDGIGAEVFDFKSLERAWSTAADPRNREHPHTTFYENPDTFTVGTIECPAEYRRPDIVLDVNTREQYEFLVELYEYCYPRNAQFHITDVIEWYDNVYKRIRK